MFQSKQETGVKAAQPQEPSIGTSLFQLSSSQSQFLLLQAQSQQASHFSGLP